MERILDDNDFKKIRAIKKRKIQEIENMEEENIEEFYMSRLNMFGNDQKDE